jgi:peroxiredoxin
MKPGRGTRAITILVQALVLSGAAVSSAAALAERDQNDMEADYAWIAKGAGLPQLCARIYPGATAGAGANPVGWQVWYAQSRCYYDVAVKTGDARLCDKVRSLSTLFVNGSGINARECRKDVATEKRSPGTYIPWMIARPILEKMGYTEAMIPREFLREADESDMWLKFLDSIATTPDFISRIDRLPDYSKDPAATSTTTCQPPYILSGVRPGMSFERGCCMDMNRNGACDEEEFKGEHVHAKDLVIEVTPGKPPTSLCGDRAFDVEVGITNNGLFPVRPGSGYVTMMPVNPAAFGLTGADFYKPLPAIPPGARVTVRFEQLRYRDGLTGRGNGMPIRTFLCFPHDSNDCTDVVPLNFYRHDAGDPECMTNQALRLDSGTCPASYMADRESGGKGGCCIDVDHDARCDEREWEASEARPESLRVQFPKADPAALTFQEGVAGTVRVTVRNTGPVPLGGHDGLIRLVLPPRVPVAAAEAELWQPLPSLAPGEEKVVTFGGLRFTPTGGSYPVQSGGFLAHVCMRGGCFQADYGSGTFRVKNADRILAEQKAHAPAPARAPARPVQGPVLPAPIVGADGSLTRSTLDPLALAELGRPAPDFSLMDVDGHFFRLILVREKKNVLLVMCPQPGSEGCRARLAALEAAKADLARLDVEVCVLSDRPDAVPAASRPRPVPGFTWLNDYELRVSSCYARRVPGEKAGARPMLVLVDKQGTIRRMGDDTGGRQPSTEDLLRSIRQK